MTSRNFFVAFLEGFVGDPIGDFSIIFEGHGVAFRLRLGFKMKVFERWTLLFAKSNYTYVPINPTQYQFQWKLL